VTSLKRRDEASKKTRRSPESHPEKKAKPGRWRNSPAAEDEHGSNQTCGGHYVHAGKERSGVCSGRANPGGGVRAKAVINRKKL